MQTLWQDLRYGLRMLRNSPGFTIVAVLTLALGIGSSTLVFSIVYSILIQPLPYKDFKRLAVFQIEDMTKAGGDRTMFSVDELNAFREQNHVFTDLVGYNNDVNVVYNDGHGTRDILGTSGAQSHPGSGGAYVTTNTFRFYGVLPFLGRALTDTDGAVGAQPVFVMNYRLWKYAFREDPRILDRTFILNGEPRTLVGIMSARFQAYGASVWLPITMGSGASPRGVSLKPIGRLKQGVSLKTAAADLTVIASRLPQSYPGKIAARFSVEVDTLADNLVQRFTRTLFTLVAAVSLLLLIACTNVANLLLARATARRQEMAIRASMGAGWGRLVQQPVVETFVLAAAGCTLGCFAAYAGLTAIARLMPAHRIPDEVVLRLSPVALVFALAISIAVTFICGLAPAVRFLRDDRQLRLTGASNRADEAFRHKKVRGRLVIAEVALSLVLLLGAGLMLRSFFALTHVSIGFDPEHVLYLRLTLPKGQYQSVQQREILFQRILGRLTQGPAVEAAAESWSLPPQDFKTTPVTVPGSNDLKQGNAVLDLCSEDYFRTLELRLLRGRPLSAADVQSRRLVAVVNEALARDFFGNEDPVGKKIKFDVLDQLPDAPHNSYFEIVGVVSDFRNVGLQRQPAPEALLPNTISAVGIPIFLARSSVNPDSLLQSAYAAVWAEDPNIAVNMSGSLKNILNEYVFAEPRFELSTLAAFSGTGLLFVVIGVFSVSAYMVSLETHNIGIRMALGAQRSDIAQMVLKDGLGLIFAGTAIGIVLSLASTRILAAQIWGISRMDPVTFVLAAFCVVAAGLAACLIPARRAMRVDPMVALRHE